MHGGGPPVVAGTPLPPAYKAEDVALVTAGCSNLRRHIENTLAFGLSVVVAINRFASDTDAEVAAIRDASLASGACDAVVSTHHADGGAGAAALAAAVVAACEAGANGGGPSPAVPTRPALRFTYELEAPIASKIEAVVRGIYRGDGVALSPLAQQKIELYTAQGFGNLPICVAKTQYSFSSDAALKGAPTGFTIPVRDVRLSAGAGFVVVLVGACVCVSSFARSHPFSLALG